MKATDPYNDRLKSLKDLTEFYEFAKNIPVDGFGGEEVVNRFSKLASESFMSDLIQYELNNIRDYEYYSPPGANYTTIQLVNAPNYSIDLTAIDSQYISTDKAYIASLKQDYLILCLTEGGIPYSIYQQNNEINPAILDKSKGLNLISNDETLEYGQCLYLKQYRDLFKYNKISENKKVIILTLIAKQPTTFIWNYNISTLLPEKMVATIQDSRIENICILLSNFQDSGSVSSMKHMLDHPKHNIRWTALKTLMNLDFEEGCKAIENLINDPHPEIRMAAKTTQELIKLQLTT
jgi:hypothetical protein